MGVFSGRWGGAGSPYRWAGYPQTWQENCLKLATKMSLRTIKPTTMRAIQEIVDAPLLELHKPKELAHGMKLHRVLSDGPFSFKVVATVPFPPSCFNGTGQEDRQGIVLAIADDVYKQLQSFSESFQAQLSTAYPDLDGKWVSPLKPATDKYPANLRAKINLRGNKACSFYDLSGTPTGPPSDWRRLEVTAVIRIGGVYVQARGAGMLLDVTHLQYDPAQSAQNPFA